MTSSDATSLVLKTSYTITIHDISVLDVNYIDPSGLEHGLSIRKIWN